MSAVTSPARWRRRRIAALSLRVVVVLAPAVVALLISWALSTWLPPGPSMASRMAWAAGTIAASLAAGVLVARILRRTLPLAWLLKIDLAFPDAAPSRFAMALKASRTADLAADLRDDRIDGDDREAAERIVSLAAALTAHDRGTRGHSERVRGYTRLIGESMGIARDDLDKLAWAGLLHDVGKLAVDPDILNKPHDLEADEAAVMRRHPIEGARLAAPLMPWLGDWGLAIAHHHERWDGTGYPAGLSGRRISLGGRIVAVADAFEAMTANRAYSTPRTLKEAREELVATCGSQFDPMVVRALLSVPLRRLSRLAIPSLALGILPSLSDTALGLGMPLRGMPAVAREATVAVAGAAVLSTAALTAAGPTPSDAAAAEAQNTQEGTGQDLTAAIIPDDVAVTPQIPPTSASIALLQPDGGALADAVANPPAIPSLSPWTPPRPSDPGRQADGPGARPAAPPARPDPPGRQGTPGHPAEPGPPATAGNSGGPGNAGHGEDGRGGDADRPGTPAAPPATGGGPPADPSPASPPAQPPADPPPFSGGEPPPPGPADPAPAPVEEVVEDLPIAGPAAGQAAGAVGEAVREALDEVLPAAPAEAPAPAPPAAANAVQGALDDVLGRPGGSGPAGGGGPPGR